MAMLFRKSGKTHADGSKRLDVTFTLSRLDSDFERALAKFVADWNSERYQEAELNPEKLNGLRA